MGINQWWSKIQARTPESIEAETRGATFMASIDAGFAHYRESPQDIEKRRNAARFSALAQFIYERKTATQSEVYSQIQSVIFAARAAENMVGQKNAAARIVNNQLTEETDRLLALVFCNTEMSAEAVQGFLDALIEAQNENTDRT